MFAQHFDLLLGLLQKPNAIKWTYSAFPSEAEPDQEPDVFDVWLLRQLIYWQDLLQPQGDTRTLW